MVYPSGFTMKVVSRTSLSCTLARVGERLQSVVKEASPEVCFPESSTLDTDRWEYSRLFFTTSRTLDISVLWSKSAALDSPFCMCKRFNLYFDLPVLYDSPAKAEAKTLLDPMSPCCLLS